MRYHLDELFDLMAQVDEQGGQQLAGHCASRKYPLTGDQHPPITLDGCGGATLLGVPYRSEGDLSSAVQVCAVDDDVGRWPRFGGDAYATQERS